MSSRLILVTGGLGFIGKHFVAACLDRGDYVINVDRVNYAADRVMKCAFKQQPNYRFMEVDVCDLEYLPECDIVVNFAAESHVDNAIANNYKFCRSNIIGVQHLLELVRNKQEHERPRFVQISSDEVYGDSLDGKFTEDDLLRPSNPYSATKASADMLVQSWSRTYKIPFNIVRPSNNYGTHQYPEKLIPKSSWRMKRGLPALMHGDGSYVRSWLHAEDTVAAIMTVLEAGEIDSIYNVSGDLHLRNIEVLQKIAAILGVPEAEAWMPVTDRSGQDVRYAIDDQRVRNLGWHPIRDFGEELKKIIHEIDFQRFI